MVAHRGDLQPMALHAASTRAMHAAALATLVLLLPGVAGYGTELSSSASVFRFSDLNQNEVLDGRNQTR